MAPKRINDDLLKLNGCIFYQARNAMTAPAKSTEKRVTVTFSTTQEMKDLITRLAEQDERSVSVFLNRLLRNTCKQTDDTSKQT